MLEIIHLYASAVVGLHASFMLQFGGKTQRIENCFNVKDKQVINHFISKLGVVSNPICVIFCVVHTPTTLIEPCRGLHMFSNQIGFESILLDIYRCRKQNEKAIVFLYIKGLLPPSLLYCLSHSFCLHILPIYWFGS